ncbi:PfkB family carbohydrate kinase [Reyranella sp.]|uniref:PfkB family carbohydrate kinase n=1 Tax=Reyranella sp. TaxID=1929291 RepID=UPI003BACE749
MMDKVKTLEQLGQIASEAKAKGKKVVLAHGVFDILHVGHKRHLDIGKNHGDLLFVTLTTDRHVNKGPDRPVFPEKLRAEMVAALECVDYVGISPNPGAEHVIETVKPSLYLKGSEYADEEADVTGRIKTERMAVEQHGGKILYTEDITFSSSNLSNRVLQLYPEEAAAYLKELRTRISVEDVTKQVMGVGGRRCLVIGDTILDEYIYVEPLGKPAKENIIATKYRSREIFAGGAIATANLVGQMCESVDLVTLLGKEDSREDFIRSSLHPNINLVPFYRAGGQTTVKSRLVDPAYVKKLIEVAYITDEDLTPPDQAALNGWVEKNIANYDAVIVNDFGHGMIDSALVDIVCRKAKFLAVNAQTNSANRGFNLITKYPRADFICIDEPEARLAAVERYAPIETVVREKLEKRIDCHTFVITHGKLGSIVYTPQAGVKRIPALTGEAIDTIGAGDAFFAVAAPLLASGSDPFLAAFIGNAVGAMKVRIVGQRHQITKPEILKYLSTLLK